MIEKLPFEIDLFQHTATRRWLHLPVVKLDADLVVSTHSHPKVAALHLILKGKFSKVSTHSHPKVAAYSLAKSNQLIRVSTHSHPKVAAYQSYH